MAIVIDATEGGASANSYVTLAQAETYFEARLDIDSWSGATVTDDTKNRALVTAAKRIDSNDFSGSRTSDTQALKFPRDGLGSYDGIDFTDGTTPQQVKDAQCEIAYELLADIDNGGIESFGAVKIGNVQFEDNQEEKLDSSGSSWQILLSIFMSLGSSNQVEIFRA